MTGEETMRLFFFLYGNFIGELSTVLMRKRDIHFSNGTDANVFFNACRDDRGLIYIREPLNAFRVGGEGQDTYQVNAQIRTTSGWLSFAARAYLEDVYIHNLEEFELSCKTWFELVNRSTPFIKNEHAGVSNSVSLDLVDQLLKMLDAWEKQDLELLLHLAIEKIPDTFGDGFEIEKYAVKNSRDLWVKRGD